MPNPQDLQGKKLFDAGGEAIGVIEGIYLDNTTRTPEWAAVRIGAQALALVPLAEASASGGGVRVDYPRDQVLGAPFHLTALDNEVTEDTENQLYAYYSGDHDGSPSATANGGTAAGKAKDVAGTAKKEATDVAATAKDQAADVAATAKDEAADVVAAAKDETAGVVAAAKDEAAGVVELAKAETAEVAHVATVEARDLVDTTRTELESQAEAQLAQLSDFLRRTAGEALALARGNPDQAGPLGDLVGRAGEELQSVAAGIEQRGSQGLLEDAQRVVRQRPRGAIFGTALAVVAGARLVGTPAGDRIKEKLAPLRDQAVEAGRSVAEELKPIAQQKAERVKAVATGAADQVRQEAQGAAQDVKGTAVRSAKTVKGTTTRSATQVKQTARRSGTAVKTTAKRTARAAAPVG
jgi:cell division septum initiation protein DivIVA